MTLSRFARGVVLAAVVVGAATSCKRSDDSGAPVAKDATRAEAAAPCPTSDTATPPTAPQDLATVDAATAEAATAPQSADASTDAAASEATPSEAAAGETADGALSFLPCGEPPPGMACIPGGPFWRGSDDGESNERPRQQVVVSTFYMDLREVTIEDFDACVATGVCRRPMPYRDFRVPRQPAVAVDWFNARSYCAWVGGRLPTEAEWEKAARGTEGATYPWGADEPTCERARYKGCLPDTTARVGSFAPGFWGLFDMAGNSYEWVADWYSPCYSGCANECGADCAGPDPLGPCGGADVCPGRHSRVLRGGSWYWPKEQIRSASRRPMKPDSGVHRLGFRCALGAGEPQVDPAVVSVAPARPSGKVDRGALEASVAPLPPEQRAMLDATPEEPLERPPVDPHHYVRSNEPALDLWFPYIDGIGGGYFGIGADQNYTMLARARSELAWLMDYDIVVVQVHRIYRAFVLASAGPAEFVARWDDGAKEESLALIASALADDPELEALKRVYKSTQPQLTEYFDSCLTRRRSRYPTGWLSDPALYRYVKDMMAAGRIRFLRGDLLGPTTVLGIADAARKLGVPIRVVYLSNAEEWFPFNAQYRANLGALPGDELSVALRTTQRFHLPIADGKWNYQVESLAHLQRALADPAAPILGDIVYAAIPDADDGTSRLGVDTVE